ncbi:hypothetical protein D3C86_2148540 [compost metagenome]
MRCVGQVVDDVVLGQLQTDLKPECTALAQFTLNTHLPAHQLGQLFGNRQPQTRSAKAPGDRGICLLKGLEQDFQLLGG